MQQWWNAKAQTGHTTASNKAQHVHKSWNVKTNAHSKETNAEPKDNPSELMVVVVILIIVVASGVIGRRKGHHSCYGVRNLGFYQFTTWYDQ